MFLWLWRNNGGFLGYRSGDALFAPNGLQLGRFSRSLIFGSNGDYLGEMRGENRLIIDRKKRTMLHNGYDPIVSAPCRRKADLPPLGLPAGFDDFPDSPVFGVGLYPAPNWGRQGPAISRPVRLAK